MSYTADGTEVEVSLRCRNASDEGHAIISVLDKGTGIPQAALADVFRPFYRVADARDRQSGGTGLGLSITYGIIKEHQGTIQVDSRAGEGAHFLIQLPLIDLSGGNNV